jgi:hypothetical protein
MHLHCASQRSLSVQTVCYQGIALKTLNELYGRLTLATFWLFSFREEFVGRDLSLFVTLFFDLLVDPPLVAERIDNLAVPSTPEHILHGHAHSRTGSDRTFNNPMRILNQDGNAHNCSPKRLRRLAGSTFARGELVTYEELVSVQSQFAAGACDDSVLSGLPPQVFQMIKGWHESGWTPMRRLGVRADVGNAVVLLCTDQASFITGQLLYVDGGASVMEPAFPLAIQGIK